MAEDKMNVKQIIQKIREKRKNQLVVDETEAEIVIPPVVEAEINEEEQPPKKTTTEETQKINNSNKSKRGRKK